MRFIVGRVLVLNDPPAGISFMHVTSSRKMNFHPPRYGPLSI